MTYSKIFLYVSLNLFVVQHSLASERDSVRLIISRDTIKLENGKAPITLNVQNSSSSNYLLYAFKNIEDAVGDFESYCDGHHPPAETAIFIEKDGLQILPFHFITDDFTSTVTLEDIRKSIMKLKREYIMNSQWVGRHDHAETSIELNLEEFRLEKGTYCLYLMYFCGDRLKNFVTESRQTSDAEFFDAKIFKGYLVSNKVTLVVE